MRIGFIGLGRMGRPMAVNLMKAGYTLTVHNRSQAVVEALVGQGAKRASSPADVARASDVVFTCLPRPEDVEHIFLGNGGAIEGACEQHIFVDTSTIDPLTSRKVGSALAEKGVAFLDAPISGGPKGAEAATLTIMVGGEPEAFTKVQPVLETLGKNIFHLGPIGAGATAKICNQLIVGVTHALVSEAMVLGTKAGVEPRALYEVMKASSGQSRSLERAVPNFILPGRFDAAFAMDGIYKDLECAIKTGKALGVRLLLPTVAQQCYEEARALGHAQEDVAAVIRPMERIAGVEVRAGE
ncbi:MAG: NAD(P)-dependent oxidoreductase [Acidiferrobacterales bacterium]